MSGRRIHGELERRYVSAARRKEPLAREHMYIPDHARRALQNRPIVKPSFTDRLGQRRNANLKETQVRSLQETISSRFLGCRTRDTAGAAGSRPRTWII